MAVTLTLHLTSGRTYVVHEMPVDMAQHVVDQCRRVWRDQSGDPAMTFSASRRDVINLAQVEQVDLPDGVT